MSVVIPDPLFGILSQACNYVWDVNLLDWVPMEQPIIEGGTIVVGAVDQGAAGVSPWLVTGTVAVSNFPAIQPISAAALPLPSNAAQETGGNLATIATNSGTQATAAKQDTSNASLASIDGKLTNPLPISGTVTANAGTNLNTSLLALESGGNLATLAGKDFATQTTLALLAGYVLALNTAQQADADGVVGPLVQSLVSMIAPTYSDSVVAPLSLTLGARVRTMSETEESASAWDVDEDTGWNLRASAMNFSTVNFQTIDNVWES